MIDSKGFRPRTLSLTSKQIGLADRLKSSHDCLHSALPVSPSTGPVAAKSLAGPFDTEFARIRRKFVNGPIMIS